MFALRVWDDESVNVTYYSVWTDIDNDESLCEMDKFLVKYDETHKEDTQALITLIYDVIGDKYGALDMFFNRSENDLAALPYKGKIRNLNIKYPNFPLRLFCLPLNENLVILFNGGVKRTQAIQEDQELLTIFRNAESFAAKILDAWKEGMITWTRIEEDLFHLMIRKKLFYKK